MNITWLPMVIGALLIVAGIGQIYLQMYQRRRIEDRGRNRQSVELSTSKVAAQSAYVGTTMIAIGAVLMLGAGFFAR